PGLGGALGAGLDRIAARGGEPVGASEGESVIVARAYDGGGRRVASMELRGSEPYGLTARILAWAAAACAAGDLTAGAHGPVGAFGAPALERGCAQAGLRRVEGDA
ncbi:MAG: saccharopine dehydrogenase, partial [Solirubrobacterales bacterium]|nr:saccharopine dehydrogenase [Solirubrobacterales bacterium]